MKAARALRWARRQAGLTQRVLAERTGVPQSTIGRIESGHVDPRTATLARLLRTCGYDLALEAALGQGVDRSLIREMLGLSPTQRVARLVAEARWLRAIDGAHRGAGGA